MNKRDYSIDILRAIALIGMIVAHCDPNEYIMQLRGFDVPLIVFLSGVSYVISSNKNNENNNYLSYCWKRFKRLAFPAWAFLLLYYMVLFVGLGITGNLKINWEEVIRNFTFTTGWYVWIIRVFLIIALCAPFLYKWTKALNTYSFLVLLTGTLVLYEFIACITNNEVYYYLTMTIPYLLMFMYGAMTPKMSNKSILLAAGLFFVIYIGMAIYYYYSTGAFQITQICKYPPRMYYMSFAIAATSFLWVFRKGILRLCDTIKVSSVLSFIGSHTLWIYFWHIIFLLILNGRFGNNYILFVAVLLLAILADYIQVRIVKRIIRNINNDLVGKNLSLLLLG